MNMDGSFEIYKGYQNDINTDHLDSIVIDNMSMLDRFMLIVESPDRLCGIKGYIVDINSTKTWVDRSPILAAIQSLIDDIFEFDIFSSPVHNILKDVNCVNDMPFELIIKMNNRISRIVSDAGDLICYLRDIDS